MNSSPTILFITHDASRTGAPLFLCHFLRWFRDNSRIPFRVLAGGNGRVRRELYNDFKSLAPFDSFEPSTTAFKVLRRLKAAEPYHHRHLSALREDLLTSNIQLIYSNTIGNGEILEFLSFLDCPVICHVHELESVVRFFGEQNLNAVKKYTSKYIAASQAVKANLTENHGIPEHQIHTVHSSIPLPETGPAWTADSRVAVFRELGIPTASKLVCNCGLIQPGKGVDLFLQVADEVTRRHPGADAHFLWVGGSPDAVHQVRKDVASSSLRNVVHFIGTKLHVTPYYDASDVFLLSSREDSYPLVMLEAASRGRPILCFEKSGGAPEFVEKDAGFVVPEFNTGQMADRVIDLLSSPELCGGMGTIAKQKVFSRHDLKVSAPKIAEVIQNELTKQSAGIGDVRLASSRAALS